MDRRRILVGPTVTMVALLAATFITAVPVDAVNDEAFHTKDPLQAFVHEAYALGNDYFIHGNADTYIFRCLLRQGPNLFDGIALSEMSIWGRTGPWEIFRKEPNGDFVYVKTSELTNTACLESCHSKEYLTMGQCTWRRGWPK
jgi:hypothetical protein